VTRLVRLPTAGQTLAFGTRLGARLVAGDVLCLTGPLGAGKTTLTRGIGAALGVADVASPTFVIARRHPGSPALLHVDAYRVGSELEFDDLGLETDDCVTVIEWGGDFAEMLSDSWLELRLERADDEVRTLTLVGRGPDWPAARLDAIVGDR